VPQYKYLDNENGGASTTKAEKDIFPAVNEEKRKTTPPQASVDVIDAKRNSADKFTGVPKENREDLCFDSQKVSDVSQAKLMTTDQYMNNDFGEDTGRSGNQNFL